MLTDIVDRVSKLTPFSFIFSIFFPRQPKFDADGDGKITKEELRKLLDTVNYQLTWDRNRDREYTPSAQPPVMARPCCAHIFSNC